MINWLIQSNLLDYQQISQVCDAVRMAGGNVVEATVIPFVDDIGNPEVLEGLSGVVIPYGSTKLTKIVMTKGWSGSFFDHDLFRTDAWDELGDRLLNNDQELMRVGDAPILLKDRDPKALVFIRPRDDLKAFNGTVTTYEEVMRWMKSTESGNFSFDEDTIIMLSSVKKIAEECRWFIVNGKVVDGSRYRLHGQLIASHINEGHESYAEAQELANIWLPHKTVVMDTALTEDGLKVIEYNCFNSSGFYKHDIPKIIEAVSEYATIFE